MTLLTVTGVVEFAQGNDVEAQSQIKIIENFAAKLETLLDARTSLLIIGNEQRNADGIPAIFAESRDII